MVCIINYNRIDDFFQKLIYNKKIKIFFFYFKILIINEQSIEKFFY